MALKNGKVNPLNALGVRRVFFPAHQFTYAELPKYSPIWVNNLNDWIYNNLNGRYYIGQSLGLVGNTITYTTRVGFESEKELSFFTLACPLL